MSKTDFGNPNFRRKMAEEAAAKQSVKPKEFIVEDPVQILKDSEEAARYFSTELGEVTRIREEVIAKQSVLNPNAKKRVEILSGIGRVKKDVAIDGVQFSLRTLKVKEIQEISNLLFSNSNNLETLFNTRKIHLSYSLFAIDGNKIEDILETDDLDAKQELIEELDETTIQVLYKEYGILNEESKIKYGLNDIKVEEVSEDIKK